jgi:hypothetical protein
VKLPGNLDLVGGHLLNAAVEIASSLPAFVSSRDDGRMILVTTGSDTGFWVGQLNNDSTYGKVVPATSVINQIRISGNTVNNSLALSGSVVFAGGNNVTLSQVTAPGVATITIIGGASANFSAGVSTGGNTAGNTGTIGAQVVLVGGNNVTLSQNTGGAGSATVTISGQTVPPIATTVASVGSANSVGTVTRFAPEDHVHAGIIQARISGNTSNTSNIIQGSLVLAGGNNITLSQVSAPGAATITISGPNLVTLRSYEIEVLASGTGDGPILPVATSGRVHLYPFQLYQHVAGEYLAVVMSMGVNFGNAVYSESCTLNWGLYTRPEGGNNSILSLAGSNSLGLSVTQNGVSISINQPTTTQAGGGYGTVEVQNTNQSNISANYTARKLVLLGLGSTLTPGQYWLGVHQLVSTVGFNSGLSFVNLVGHSHGLVGLSPIGSAATDFGGSGSNATLQVGGNWRIFAGSYSVGNPTGLPSTIVVSQIDQFSSSNTNFGFSPSMKLESRT